MKDLQTSRKIGLWRSLSLILLVAVLAMAGAAYWYYTTNVKQMNTQISDLTHERNQLQDKLTQQQADFEQQSAESELKAKTEYTSKNGQLITVTTPIANTKVNSPIDISGTAPGNWFNEGIFDIVLENSNGTVIAKTTAEMTGSDQTKPADFKARLAWSGQEDSNAILILKKANPSGLETNNDQVEIALKL